jgi:uncharacterized protein YjiS (DUF1127 family)
MMSTLLQERPQRITTPRLGDPVAVQIAAPPASAGDQPAATVPIGPVGTPHSRWRGIVSSLRAWRRRRVARRELAQLDERILRDLGIDRDTVNYEMQQPFWRPLRDWQR